MRSFIKLFLIHVLAFSSISLMSCGGKTVKKGEGYFKKLPNGGEINGPRSIENIEANIKMLMPRFEYYHNKRLRINPDLHGTIELIFDIDAYGNVFYSTIGKSSTNDPDFNNEVLHAVTLHKFGEWPQGKGKTEVIYPFTFSKKEIGPAKENIYREVVKPPRKIEPERKDKVVEEEAPSTEEIAPEEEKDVEEEETEEEETEEEETEEERIEEDLLDE